MQLSARLLIVLISFALIQPLFASETAHTNLFPQKQADPSKAVFPAKATLVSPKIMSEIKDTQVKLEWSAEGVKNFHLQVATDPNFKWLVVDEKLYTSTSFELKGLEAGKHYYWRVASVNPDQDPGYIKSAFVKSMFSTP